MYVCVFAQVDICIHNNLMWVLEVVTDVFGGNQIRRNSKHIIMYDDFFSFLGGFGGKDIS